MLAINTDLFSKCDPVRKTEVIKEDGFNFGREIGKR